MSLEITPHRDSSIRHAASRAPNQITPSPLILPDQAMNMEGMLSLHAEYSSRKFLVLDSNPFSQLSMNDIQKFLVENRTWFRIVDHHGQFSDNTKQATLPRLLKLLPEFLADGFLGPEASCVTNFQNLDPDGLLSFYAVTYPKNALALSELLSQTANYSDFALFGEERFDESLPFDALKKHQHLCFALLQLITDEKGRFVERVTGKKLVELDADSIRATFVDPNTNAPATFNHYAVYTIYHDIVNQWLPGIVEDLIARDRPGDLLLNLSARAFQRLRLIYEKAREVTEVIGVDPQHPSGKVALMAEKTGFIKRLDKDYLIYDWLMESAGQYCVEAPIHVRLYRDMLVISVRFPRHGESRSAEFDMKPVMDRLNQALGEIGETAKLFGRQEVVLGRIDSRKLSIDAIVKLLLEQWPAIELPKGS